MKLSIHLITYNSEKYLPFCLKSLNEQTFQDFSVLIIDNNSQDGSINFIEQYLADPKNKIFADKAKFIKNSRDFGFAGAHNQAIQWTKSEYIFMMNPDVILDSDYIKILIDFLEKNSDTAAVAGAIYKWDLTKVNQESLVKTEKIDSLGLKLFPSHKIIELTDMPNQNKPQEIFGVSGALPIYRRSALELVKMPIFHPSFKFYLNQKAPELYEYFDNDFFCYKEDVDLAYRLRWAGYDSCLLSSTIAWHDRGLSADETGGLLKLIKQRRLWSAELRVYSWSNHLAFLIKNESLMNFVKDFPFILWFEFKKFIYLLIFEPNILGRGLGHLFKRFFKLTNKRRLLKLTHRVLAADLRAWFRHYG